MSQKTHVRLAATLAVLAAASPLAFCAKKSEPGEPIVEKPRAVATAPAAPAAPEAPAPAPIAAEPAAAEPAPSVAAAPPTKTKKKKKEPKERDRVTEAVQIGRVNPQYPELCKRHRIEGVVTLRANVTAKGEVSKVNVLNGVHPLLDGAASRAVQQWKYRPAMVDGRPVPSTVKVTVGFRL